MKAESPSVGDWQRFPFVLMCLQVVTGIFWLLARLFEHPSILVGIFGASEMDTMV